MGMFFSLFLRIGPASKPESIQKEALQNNNANGNSQKK
jgi:hypothetical protein